MDARPVAARTLELTSALDAALDLLVRDRSESALDAARRELRAHPPRLSAEALSVHRVPAGAGVSYGHTYRTRRESWLVDVAIGYGHGVPRMAGNATTAHWRSDAGVLATIPIVGRVAMDDLVADAGDLPVRAGDRIVLFGDPVQGETAVDAWAGAIGEDPVSLLCALDPIRIRRVIV